MGPALGAIVGDSTLFFLARRSAARVRPQLDRALQNERIAIGAMAWQGVAMEIVAQGLTGSIDKLVLLAVPGFIFAGGVTAFALLFS